VRFFLFSLLVFVILESLSGCGSDAPEEQDVKPPTIYLSGDCSQTGFPDDCFRSELVRVIGRVSDDSVIAEALIVFNGVSSTLELDERGMFGREFDTDKCPDSDDTRCLNTIEVTAVDILGNSASESCDVSYLKEYVPRRVIVKFIPDTTEARRSEIHAGIGAEVLKDMEMNDYYLVLVPVGISVEEGIEYYEAYPEVDHASPDYLACLYP
jgi:hypothetical protein